MDAPRHRRQRGQGGLAGDRGGGGGGMPVIATVRLPDMCVNFEHPPWQRRVSTTESCCHAMPHRRCRVMFYNNFEESRAAPSRAEPSRAEPSRAEPAKPISVGDIQRTPRTSGVRLYTRAVPISNATYASLGIVRQMAAIAVRSKHGPVRSRGRASGPGITFTFAKCSSHLHRRTPNSIVRGRGGCTVP